MSEILGVFGIDWKILIVQIVNFTVLLLILWRILYRPLVGFIEKRRSDIIEGVARTERAETLLAEANNKKKSVITDATLKAEDIIERAREAAKTKEEIAVKLAEEKAQRIVSEAEMRAQDEHRRAMDESREEMAKLIVLGVEKTLKEAV